ncbi:MAG: wax ester/triacylglycerol synthase family O-acyltransferase [Deltaproteobacteria bacterium]|nr:wax ester/triacylglycerol synthase family O-acyltransferase [Deltaproteobacteria bacterium]
MHRLSPIDQGFLIAESRETPMHIGGLYLFTLPEGADEQEFLWDMHNILTSVDEWRRPFGHKLKSSAMGAVAHWVPDEHLDVDYHVRHSALPKPGRYRELFQLVGRLHQTLLDRHRPLWETHLIEGLQNRQFALYSKVHHAAVDGVAAMRLAMAFYTADPGERRDYSPYSMEAERRYRAMREAAKEAKARASEPPSDQEVNVVAEVLRESFGLSRHLMGSLREYARAWRKPAEKQLATSWKVSPQTSFSTKVTGARRFVAQSYSLDRVKAVGKAMGGTVNDVVLAMCGGGLRRYLKDRGELPTDPLTAMTPVSIRTEKRGEYGNSVGALVANLATHLDDAAERFRATQASMNEGKDLLRGMSPKEVELFTQLTQAPAMLVGALGLADRFPPYSTVISNVPGPSRTVYYNGARIDGMYPMSSVYHGFALNFTLISNADQLDFGIIACRESAPSIQRIIDDLEDALVDLEEAAGIR